MLKQEKKVKRSVWFKIELIILSFIVIAAMAVSAFIYIEISKIREYVPVAAVPPHEETFKTEDDPAPNVHIKKIEPDEVIWPEGTTPLRDKSIYNILLIGQDKRGEEGRQRADCIIIASYNVEDGSVKLTSLMRDLYVQIPGYSDNRINAAYALGGMELLDKCIEHNFGVTIDGNFEVDFEAFVHIIDILNGVDIELKQEEAEYLNGSKASWKLKEDRNHLSGEQALAYARIRYIGEADFERTERQRRIISAIVDEVLSYSTARKLKMLERILPYLTTDLTKVEIFSYALTVVQKGVSSVDTYRIPADGAYEQAMIREMAVLVPDLDKNRELLSEYIYGVSGS